MRTLWTAVAALSSAAMLVSAVQPAAAYTRHHHHYYRTEYRHNYAYRDDCWAEHHRSANTGTVLGAIGGGIIGSQLAGRGSRGLGTVLGAGGGAVVGHQLGAHAHRCR
jgi:uncharacterized protein YcfJ